MVPQLAFHIAASADLVASGIDASVEIVFKVAAYADHPVQSFRDAIYTPRTRFSTPQPLTKRLNDLNMMFSALRHPVD